LMELTGRKNAELHGKIREVRAGLRREAEREFRRCREKGIDLIAIDDPRYPPCLREIPAPPLLLYSKGAFAPEYPRVALVGSRRCTRYGLRVATELAAGLAGAGVEVVSGGARGIDTAAHQGALAGGGTTLSVLGSGLEVLYPPENEDLFEKIRHSGAVISEFPLRMSPEPGHFPRRNRVIAGLCSAVVVVEAARKSGSLITVRHALEQGRDVLAVPGPISSSTSSGCNRLLRDGAKPVLGVEDILEELEPGGAERGGLLESLGDEPAPGSGKTTTFEEENSDIPTDLTDNERKVLEFLDRVEPSLLDHMVERIPMPIAPLQVALFGLTARRLVEQLPGRYYLRRP